MGWKVSRFFCIGVPRVARPNCHDAQGDVRFDVGEGGRDVLGWDGVVAGTPETMCTGADDARGDERVEAE